MGRQDSLPIFNVVFIGTLISLIVQGTTVSGMANWLGLAYEEKGCRKVRCARDKSGYATPLKTLPEATLAAGRTVFHSEITLLRYVKV